MRRLIGIFAGIPVEQEKTEKSIVISSVVVIVAILLVMSILAIMKQRTQDDIKQQLQTSLNRTLSELDLWASEIKKNGSYWSELPSVKGNIQELLKVPRTQKSLLASFRDNELDDILRAEISRHKFDGYMVIAPDYTNIASMLKVNVGQKNLLSDTDVKCREIQSGRRLHHCGFPKKL